MLSNGTRIIHALLENTDTNVQCVGRDTSVGYKSGALIEGRNGSAIDAS